VGCEGDNWSSNNNGKVVYGRFIVTEYRLRFIENGKRETEEEQYYAGSIPYGSIMQIS
jgi:hypothetical protein